jgi:MoaA/NifB/PqqE/SkfB family radical SAM enzyme
MFMIVPTGRGQEIMSELIGKEDYEEILRWHYEMEKERGRDARPPHLRAPLLPGPAAEDEGVGEDVHPRSLTFSTGGGKGCVCAQSICFIDSRGTSSRAPISPRSPGT